MHPTTVLNDALGIMVALGIFLANRLLFLLPSTVCPPPHAGYCACQLTLFLLAGLPPVPLQNDALGIVLANWPLFLLAASLGLIVNLISLYIIKTSGSTALKVRLYSVGPGLSVPHFHQQCESVLRPLPAGSEHNVHTSVNACPLACRF